MITIEEAIEQFHTTLPLEVQEEFGKPAVVKDLDRIGGQYGVDLSALAVFVALGELRFEDLASYIEEEFGFDPVKSAKLARELREGLFDQLVNRLNFLNADPNKSMSIEQEKFFAEQMFRSGLLAELDGSPIIIDAINMRLFFILARADEFKKKLEQALYDNDELLTEGTIMVNGQPVRPTIGNWIKDFISRQGSQSFDSVSQSTFLINSENGRMLDEYDRERLAAVIKTYVNIKFFPDSMPSDDGEGWAILPGGTVEDEAELGTERESKTESDSPQPFAEAPAATESVAKPQSEPAPAVPVAIKPPVPAPSESDEALALKNMLLQYPAGSIERKAIEEELKKLERR